MPRFRKGTTDHDNDGRMGGSMKENDMAKSKTKAAAKPSEPKVANKAPEAGLDVQSGMEPGLSPKEERARINEQFAKADEKAQAAIVDATQVGLQVRGY